jgi:signal transduction histidine kinase
MLVRNRSLRVRVTVVAAVIAALVCLCMSVVLIVGMRAREMDHARQRVHDTAERLMTLIDHNRLPMVLLPRQGVQAVQILNADKHVVSSTGQLAGEPAMARFGQNGDLPGNRMLCPPAGLRGCMSVFAFEVPRPDGAWTVYEATPVIPWYADGTVLLFAIGVSVVIVTMMAAGAFRLVGKTLAPVDAIRAELAAITATDLNHRVPVPQHQQETKLLAETVNDTLDRLQTAHEQLQHFTSDASHDLRSPLAAVQVQVEEALMCPDDTDWPRTATAVLAGMERAQAIMNDLLTLARMDAGETLTFEPADLAQLVGVELDRRPRRMRITRNLQPGVFVECDRLRIARLVTNLIDNAERHAETQMAVMVYAEGALAVMEVTDDGAGIAVELREVVFERFTRLDASRVRDAKGTGLGLAIARQIAHAHRGTLTIDDSPRGARFVLRLERIETPLAA